MTFEGRGNDGAGRLAGAAPPGVAGARTTLRQALDVDREATTPNTTAEAPIASRTKLGILATGRRHWGWILLGGLLGLASAGFVAEKRLAPSFQATSTVHVDPLPPRLLYRDDEWQRSAQPPTYMAYLRTLVELASSDAVIGDAIDSLVAAGRPWSLGATRAEQIASLRGAVRVEAIKDTQLIRLTVRDGRKHHVAPAVNAIGVSLAKSMQDERGKNLSAVKTPLEEDRGVVALEFQGVRNQLDALPKRFLARLTEGLTTSPDNRVATLAEESARTGLVRAEAEAGLAAAKERAVELAKALDPALVEALLDDDPRVRETQVQYERKIRDQVESLAGFGPRHPNRIDGELRIAAVRGELASTLLAARDETKRHEEARRREEGSRLVELANARFQSARSADEHAQAELLKARAELEEGSRIQMEARRLADREAELKSRLTRIDQRLEELVVESRAPSRVAVKMEAADPTSPVRDLRLPITACGLGLGALLGLAFGGVREKQRPLLYGPADLARIPTTRLVSTDRADALVSAKDALMRLGLGSNQEPLNLLVAGTPDRPSLRAAAQFAETLAVAAGQRTSTLLVSVQPGPELDQSPEVERSRGLGGPILTWKPKVPSDRVLDLLTDQQFQSTLAVLEQGVGVRIVHANSLADSPAAMPLLSRQYVALIVAQTKHADLHTIEASLQLIREAKGRFGGVVVVEQRAARRG